MFEALVVAGCVVAAIAVVWFAKRCGLEIFACG